MRLRLVLTNLKKGRWTVKKLLSALVIAGLLAVFGCGGDSGTGAKKEKDTAKKDADKKDAGKPVP